MANILTGLGGAGTGAAIGSAFGPIGTAIGALGGGLAGLFGGGSSKSRQPAQVMPIATQNQQQLQNQALAQALSLLSGQNGLNPIAQQSVRRFKTETVPSLAERFTSMGGQSRLNSPQFAAQLGQAGSNLEQDLSAQQYGLLALLSGLGNRAENIYQPEEPGFNENLLLALARVAPELIGAYGMSRNVPTNTSQTSSPIKFPSIQGYQLGGNPIPSYRSPLSQILGSGY